MANEHTPAVDPNHNHARDAVAGLIARWIVYGAVIYLSVMSILFVGSVIVPGLAHGARIDDATVTAWKDVVGLTVPVLAAWVGTILAFYFAKENFETANKSVREMSEMVNRITAADKLRGISAREVMVPRGSIIDIKLTAGQDAASIALEQDLIAKLNGKVTRLPIFQEDDRILCVVHESAAHKFLYQARQSNGQANPTLQELLRDGEMGSRVIALAFVREGASLSDAQDAMKKVDRCQDVFVTKSGRRDEPVLGWITNADIAKQLEV